MNLKGTRPTAWWEKLLPAASAVLRLKATGLKYWSEINFLVFGGLQSFCLILFRWLQLWNTACAWGWFRELVSPVPDFIITNSLLRLSAAPVIEGVVKVFIVETALWILIGFQAVVLCRQGMQNVLWDAADFWQACLLPTNEQEHLWGSPLRSALGWGPGKPVRGRTGSLAAACAWDVQLWLLHPAEGYSIGLPCLKKACLCLAGSTCVSVCHFQHCSIFMSWKKKRCFLYQPLIQAARNMLVRECALCWAPICSNGPLPLRQVGQLLNKMLNTKI